MRSLDFFDFDLNLRIEPRWQEVDDMIKKADKDDAVMGGSIIQILFDCGDQSLTIDMMGKVCCLWK